MVKIAIDAMGGDNAPDEILAGSCQAVDSHEIHLVLVGPENLLKEKLAKIKCGKHERITIVNADEIVEMGESPTLAYKRKKNSSIRVGLNLLKAGEVDGFLSAGNTGAVLTASVLTLGKIKNIDRPAVATVIPSVNGPTIMLDMGTNVDCKPNQLEQFALMGNSYAKTVFNIENPRVGLLNIGEEVDKGNSLTQATYKLLEKLNINFVGNIEGKAIFKNSADVVVCDGFVGNNLLKFGEGVVDAFTSFFKQEAKRSLLSIIGLFFLAPALKRFKKSFDYAETGGAPLLGVNGVSFIAHGKSDSRAIKNGLKNVKQAIETKMIENIAKAVAE